MSWAVENWDILLADLVRHAWLSAASLAVAIVLALSLGLAVRHRPRTAALLLTIAGLVYTIPSIALFALLLPLFGLGTTTAIVGLSASGVMVLLRNMLVGLAQIPSDLVEAARGMGMSPRQLFFRVELPLALPIWVAGLRIAASMAVGSATVAAYIDAGGLGEIIFTGIQQEFDGKIAVGAVAATVLALAIDQLVHRLERLTAARAGL